MAISKKQAKKTPCVWAMHKSRKLKTEAKPSEHGRWERLNQLAQPNLECMIQVTDNLFSNSRGLSFFRLFQTWIKWILTTQGGVIQRPDFQLIKLYILNMLFCIFSFHVLGIRGYVVGMLHQPGKIVSSLKHTLGSIIILFPVHTFWEWGTPRGNWTPNRHGNPQFRRKYT
jgi:hypothetical protein